MKVEWLYEARCEFRDFLLFYKNQVGPKYARRFSDNILSSIRQLGRYPELGVLREDTLLGQYGFRALFIDQYVCIYKIEDSVVVIYHIVDGRRNYIYQIFGMNPISDENEDL